MFNLLCIFLFLLYIICECYLYNWGETIIASNPNCHKYKVWLTTKVDSPIRDSQPHSFFTKR